MKILLTSDSPFVASGYALQATAFAKRAVQAGYEVVYFGTSYVGRPQVVDGYKVLGGIGDPFGNTNLISYVKAEQPDCVITFKDPYVYHPQVLQQLKQLGVPWFPLCPVDTEPLSSVLLSQLEHATRPIAITRNGFELINAQNINAYYGPHGIDTDFFTPGDKEETRKRLNLPSEAFIALFVGANQQRPIRKSIDKIITAWAQFVQKYKTSVLFLHTELTAMRGGLNIEGMMKFMKVPSHNWMATNQTNYTTGMPEAYLRELYRAADVLVNPSMGGGFEITCVEAQSCGLPVISTSFTAMRDTVWAGWKIGDEQFAQIDELEYHDELMAFRYRIIPSRLFQALELAYQNRDDDKLHAQARKGALEYDIEKVFNEYWIPILRRIERDYVNKKEVA